MQNLAKRDWSPLQSVKEAAEVCVNWVVKARQKNIISDRPPALYHAYVLNDCPPLDYMHNISSLFRYSQKDSPYIDASRDRVLRLLSVCVKAHYFLFGEAQVSHEPYFFSVPSLDNPSGTDFGIIYKIEKEDQVIVVFEREWEKMSPNVKIVFRFPVVVGSDSFCWYSIKNWTKLRAENNLPERVDKPWLAIEDRQNTNACKTIEELSLLGTILDVPYNLKDAMKPVGIQWSENLKKWYLPKGFDLEAVIEYLMHLKREHAKQVGAGGSAAGNSGGNMSKSVGAVKK